MNLRKTEEKHFLPIDKITYPLLLSAIFVGMVIFDSYSVEIPIAANFNTFLYPLK